MTRRSTERPIAKGGSTSGPTPNCASCRVDILGSEGNFKQLGRRDDRRVRIPTLARVLELLRRTRAQANIEIKNQPTDPDYDPTDGFARTVSEAIAVQRRAALPADHPELLAAEPGGGKAGAAGRGAVVADAELAQRQRAAGRPRTTDTAGSRRSGPSTPRTSPTRIRAGWRSSRTRSTTRETSTPRRGRASMP